MGRGIGRAIVGLAILMAGGASLAHHSLTAAFDVTKQVTLTGTLTKVDWRNPHIEIAIDARGERGERQSWVLQGSPTFFFRDRRISKEQFQQQIGKAVTVEAHPARDGRHFGALLKITFPDRRSVTIVPDA